MRREGFELTAGQPRVVTREIDGTTARAGGETGDRRARGLRRRRHPGARGAQGADGADGQPLDRLGAPGVPGAGARADRLPHRVPDRDARHRADAPRLRPLGAVGRRPRARGPTGSLVADRIGKTAGFALFGLQERGTLFVGPGRGGLRGDGDRRERPQHRPRRERDQGEAADERQGRCRRRDRSARAREAALPRAVPRVPARGRVRRGDPRRGSPAEGRARPDRAREARAESAPRLNGCAACGCDRRRPSRSSC